MKLDGDSSIVGNGAGLVMSTLTSQLAYAGENHGKIVKPITSRYWWQRSAEVMAAVAWNLFWATSRSVKSVFCERLWRHLPVTRGETGIVKGSGILGDAATKFPGCTVLERQTTVTESRRILSRRTNLLVLLAETMDSGADKAELAQRRNRQQRDFKEVI